MAKIKTVATSADVVEFIASAEPEQRKKDGLRLLEILRKNTGFEPCMWGPSIIGFGSYHYKYETGHEGDMPLVGFSPRKSALVLYLAEDFKDRAGLLAKLGKHKAGKACIYISKLDDIDSSVLLQLVKSSMEEIQKKHG